ncbi:MAG TPA: YfcE family phosphodiesterase [Actinobacteria bacterium]|nr:YfcE family phosphodiesterase [Actinomycetota bacterium]
MKIGVVSDTHIRTLDDLREIKEIASRHFQGVDLILHAGDLVILDVLETLKGIAKTIAISGNMDPPGVREALPSKTVIEVDRFKIGLVHGWGPPTGLAERVKGEFSEVNCIVFGHTHEPFNEIIDGILLFNPGSATNKIFASQNYVGILEVDEEIKGKIVKV